MKRLFTTKLGAVVLDERIDHRSSIAIKSARLKCSWWNVSQQIQLLVRHSSDRSKIMTYGIPQGFWMVDVFVDHVGELSKASKQAFKISVDAKTQVAFFIVSSEYEVSSDCSNFFDLLGIEQKANEWLPQNVYKGNVNFYARLTSCDSTATASIMRSTTLMVKSRA
jgi:hypothetical protein